MRWPRIVPLVVVAAAVGGAAGAGATLLLRDDDDTPARGTLVHLGPPEYLAGFTPQPFCLPLHHFCIAQPETDHPIALYTYDPHPTFREWGCEVHWNADAEETAPDGTRMHGIFTDPCGGSKYDSTGHRLFGPTPRDLDMFSLEVTDTATIVDTRIPICGNIRLADGTDECPRATGGE